MNKVKLIFNNIHAYKELISHHNMYFSQPHRMSTEHFHLYKFLNHFASHNEYSVSAIQRSNNLWLI